MFHYLSGFVSDLDLDQTADVYVFLLLPQKFAKYTNPSMFNHPLMLNRNYGNQNQLEAFIDFRGSIHDHYVPFTVPFKAQFSRDCGVFIDRDKVSPIVSWLEANFNVNLDDYLGELSEQRHPSEPEEITTENVFEYLSVAFEHVSFVDKIVDAVKKDDNFMAGINYVYQFFDYYKSSLTHGLFTGNNRFLVKKNGLDANKTHEALSEDFAEFQRQILPDAYIQEAFEYFMCAVNKTYKPCSRGNQRFRRDYIDLMNNTRIEVTEQLFSK
ncbi:hypothetical protein [Vibrio owensii]|uniref:hypothetical protein n=1 Tax=Vibrio harveyi group TaxID=717610 RepID=UPI003CC53705